jgi:hypothetical protein
MASNFLNRMLGTSDGTAGITPVVSDGQEVRNVSDRSGRLWARLFQGSAPVATGNPLPTSVQSSALPTGAATEATVAGLGTQTTLLAVNTQATAINTVLGLVADAVDRVGGATTVNAKIRGLLQIISGGVNGVNGAIVRGEIASDGVIGANDFPVRTGGRARAITNLPTAVASNDAVGATYSLQGEAFVALSTPIAGEDRTNNVMNVWQVGQSISPGWFNTNSNGATTQQHNFIASIGNIRDIRGLNLSNQPLYLFLCAKATLLVNGDVPFHAPYPVPPGGYISDDFGPTGIRSSVGWRAAWSTTPTTLTLANGGPISGRVI